MLKKLLILAFAGLLSPANAAGTVPGFSLTPQFDTFGKVAPGCKLYVIQAGTTSTPQNSYQDTGLTSAQPNPLSCDASGRLPQWFVADGLIKVRLTDKNGVQIFVGDNLLVVGPSSGGGGGGGTIDPTTIMATGDMKARYGTGVLTGFVRSNGRTIGSATSGATERANADAQPLFEYLWNTDSTLVVSTGRGASANADWVANKTIAVPDWRGQALGALADMGNSATTSLTSPYFGNDPTVLGAAGGVQSTTLSVTHLPPYTPQLNDPGHTHALQYSASFLAYQGGPVAPTVVVNVGSGGSFSNANNNTTGITALPQGGNSTPFSRIPPMKLATLYIKL